MLGFAVAVTCRDLGPMLKAELRASRTGKLLADDALPLADFSSKALEPPEGAPRRAVNAFLPILAVIAVTVLGLYLTGRTAAGTGLAGVRDACVLTAPVEGVPTHPVTATTATCAPKTAARPDGDVSRRRRGSP